MLVAIICVASLFAIFGPALAAIGRAPNRHHNLMYTSDTMSTTPQYIAARYDIGVGERLGLAAKTWPGSMTYYPYVSSTDITVPGDTTGQYTQMGSLRSESSWCESVLVARGWDPELLYLHYYDNVSITTSGGSRNIPGWKNLPLGQKRKSRVPQYPYDYLTDVDGRHGRYAINFNNWQARYVRKLYICKFFDVRPFTLANSDTAYADGIWLDNGNPWAMFQFGTMSADTKVVETSPRWRDYGGTAIDTTTASILHDSADSMSVIRSSGSGVPDLENWWARYTNPKHNYSTPGGKYPAFLKELYDTLWTQGDSWTVNSKKKMITVNTADLANIRTDTQANRQFYSDSLKTWTVHAFYPEFNGSTYRGNDPLVYAARADTLRAHGIDIHFDPGPRTSVITDDDALMSGLAFFMNAMTDSSYLGMHTKSNNPAGTQYVYTAAEWRSGTWCTAFDIMDTMGTGGPDVTYNGGKVKRLKYGLTPTGKHYQIFVRRHVVHANPSQVIYSYTRLDSLSGNTESVRLDVPGSLYQLAAGGFLALRDSITMVPGGGAIVSSTHGVLSILGTNPDGAPDWTSGSDARHRLSERGKSIDALNIYTRATDSQTITYAATGKPLGLDIHSSSGKWTGTLSSSAEAFYNVVVTATDNTGDPDSNRVATLSFTWSTYATDDGESWREPTKLYRKRIAVDPMLLPASGELYNFPVPMSVDNTGTDSTSHFRHVVQKAITANGKDIKIWTADFGRQTSREIPTWSSSAGTIFFRADTLSRTKNHFYIYYNEPAATGSELDTTVWRGGYQGAYHFEENPGAGTLKDYGHVAANVDTGAYAAGVGWRSGDKVTGKIGSGWRFNGTTHWLNADRITVPDSSFTVSSWVMLDTTDTSDNGYVNFFLQSNPGFWHTSSRVNKNTRQPDFQVSSNTGGPMFPTCTGSGPYCSTRRWAPLNASVNGVWHHYAWTFDGAADTVKFYYDGVLKSLQGCQDSGNIASPCNAVVKAYRDQKTGSTWNLGLNPSNNVDVGILGPLSYNPEDIMKGTADEYRVAIGAKSADWLATEYNLSAQPLLPVAEGGLDSTDIGGSSASWLSNYQYRVKITARGDSIGTGTHLRVPVVVQLTNLPSTLFGYDKTNGADICVTSRNGVTKLPRQIVNYDSVNTNGQLWFRADTLIAATNRDFFIYYGKSDTTIAATDTSLWSMMEAAYHFENSASPSTDFSPDPHNGTWGSSGPARGTGMIDSCVAFTDASNNKITIASAATVATFGSYTWAFWAKVPAAEVGKVFASGYSGGNRCEVHLGNTIVELRGKTLATQDTDRWSRPNNANWHHYVLTYNRPDSTTKLYIDGAADAGKSITQGPSIGDLGGVAATGNITAISADQSGSTASNAFTIGGNLDEYWIRDGVMSAGWAYTINHNQRSPSGFWSFAQEEGIPNGNNAPVITTILDPQFNYIGDYVNIQLNANDPDDDVLTWDADAVIEDPPYTYFTLQDVGLSLDAVNGIISGTVAGSTIDPTKDIIIGVTDDGSPAERVYYQLVWTIRNSTTVNGTFIGVSGPSLRTPNTRIGEPDPGIKP